MFIKFDNMSIILKNIGVGIGNISDVFTWYQIDTI